MKYSMCSMWWLLATLGMVLPAFVATNSLLHGGLEPKERGTAVLHIAIIIIAALWAVPAKKLPGLSMVISTMCGISLFATAQFAPSSVRLVAYTIAILFCGLCIWAALEVMDRKNKHVGTYLDLH